MLPDRNDALLDTYAELVRHWGRRLDLISPGDLGRFRSRHIEDSLRLLELLAALPPGPAVDVGSGAGLPGIPLAVCDRRHRWRLLEPRSRRAGFLEEAVRALELDCEVIVQSAEEAARDPGLARSHVVATARALAPPGRAAQWLRPLLAPGGIGAIWTGPGAERPAQSREWREGIAIIGDDMRLPRLPFTGESHAT